ncbi:hypothetical protein BKA70DRAFT_1264444 [Coprinopsis sp. MPI-PUGE-AT-0042]|nr:hypothetical protein BKA70DRAFT_1264444 [Coprinopsis sp. MPI-PUGE-AT-0042]
MVHPNPAPRLLARLHRDLRELTEEPYPGVAVFTDEADLRKFCLVLTPPSGPWTGLNLHFDVVLPQTWPSQPPSVQCSVTGINHPNLFGEYICCDLIKPPEWLEEGYTGGYSPALTLRGLFLQFLTFFSSNKVEQDHGGVIDIGDYIRTVSFVKEKDLPASLNPWEKCSHIQSKCDCKPTPENPSKLEASWGALEAKEIIIGRYSTPAGTMVHKVKSQEAKPTRIHKFEKINDRWNATFKLISKWKCTKCVYGSPTMPHVQPVDEDEAPKAEAHPCPPSGHLDLLNDDVLLEMAEPMTSESLISFGKAYPRFHSLVSAHHVLLQRELHCFFLKTPMREGILGVGVALDQRSRMLSSDFDWLSMEAFDMHQVRRSIQKRHFEYFLPLALSEAHFQRSKSEVWKRLHKIRGELRQIEFDINSRRPPPGHRGQRGRLQSTGGPAPEAPQNSVKVLFKMMNNIVVSLMKSCDDALSSASTHRSNPGSGISTASEKAIISYCHLMHLLTCLSRAYPVILQDAIARLKLFIASPRHRIKADEPDLGELLVAVTLVLVMSPPNQASSPSWAVFNGPILEEAITRNARWVLKDAPELEVMESGESNYRLATTFAKSKTSLRLLMFQVTFLGLFIKSYQGAGVKVLDENYGFPVKELPEMMVAEIKEIYKVNSWPAFFHKVRWAKARDASFTKEKFTDMLRSAIGRSAERGYHRPATRQTMEELRRRRRELEARAASA